MLRSPEEGDAGMCSGDQNGPKWKSSTGRHFDDEEGGDLDLKLINKTIEVQDDAYRLGGMWYVNNWIFTSKMTAEQWAASTRLVGCGKNAA